MFINKFTKVRHLSLFWARPIQSMPPHNTSWRSTFIWSSHLCLGLQSGLFLSGLLTKTPRASLLSPMRATCPAHHIFLDLIKRITFGEQYRSFCSSLRDLLQSPVTSCPLSPNIFFSTLFSKILRPRFYPNFRDQTLRPHKTTGKIAVLYVLIWRGKLADRQTEPF
jgi:hypothetical protein